MEHSTLTAAETDIIEEAPFSEIPANENEEVDLSRTFSFKHLNGEIISGSALDIQSKCTGMAGLALRHVFSMATAMEAGQNLMDKDQEKEDEAEGLETEAEDNESKIKESQSAQNTKYTSQEIKTTPKKVLEKPVESAAALKNLTQNTTNAIYESNQSTEEPVTRNETGNVGPTVVGGSSQPETIKIKPTNAPAKIESLAVLPQAKETGLTTADKASESAAEGQIIPRKEVIFKAAKNPSAQPIEILLVPAFKETEAEQKIIEQPYLGEEAKDAADEIYEDRAEITPEDQESIDIEYSDLDLQRPLVEVVETEEAQEYFVDEAISYLVDYQTELFAETELELTAQSTEISVPIEEVETTLQQLTEQMKVVDPVAAQAANEILNQIIELPARLTKNDEGEAINEVEAREELEELFVQLFDRLEIEYSPELIESCVNLTLSHQLSDEIAKLETDNNTVKEPGTHEVIKQLLAGLSSIKRALVHAYMIGKSALRLYALKYATVTAH